MIDSRSTAIRVLTEEAELKQAYDDKIRALTRRMVGVASGQMLEQDGLQDRMADLIARQEQLETRQAVLNRVAEQAASMGRKSASSPSQSTTDGTPAKAEERPTPPPAPPPPSTATPTPPTLKLGGGVQSMENEETGEIDQYAPPMQQSPFLPPSVESPFLSPADQASPAKPSPGTRSELNRPDLPLKERFVALERSMDQVALDQMQSLDAFRRGADNQFTIIQSIVTAIGLDLAKLIPSVTKEASPSRSKLASLFAPLSLAPPKPKATIDPFDAGMEAITASVERIGRLRPVIDSVPLRRPIDQPPNLTSGYGMRMHPVLHVPIMHAGLDWRAREGTPVHATGNGTVRIAGVVSGYGNLVEIDHGNGLSSRYAHLSEFKVAQGQTVKVGDLIGISGATGRVTGPHLHYETRLSGVAQDPMHFLQAGERLFPSIDLARSDKPQG